LRRRCGRRLATAGSGGKVRLRAGAASVRECAIIENCGRSVVYERLARGEYEAIKDGSRTKMIVESIKRRRDSLPRAVFKPLPPRRKRTA
jgi:N-methylhydantoinase B/oxoprolinase/acetone carboxylase alpha subunit